HFICTGEQRHRHIACKTAEVLRLPVERCVTQERGTGKNDTIDIDGGAGGQRHVGLFVRGGFGGRGITRQDVIEVDQIYKRKQNNQGLSSWGLPRQRK